MNENEKRLFADVAAEDENYVRVMASATTTAVETSYPDARS